MDIDVLGRSAVGIAFIYVGIVHGSAYLIKIFRRRRDPICLGYPSETIVNNGAKPLLIIGLLITLSSILINISFLKIIVILSGFILLIIGFIFEIINKVNNYNFPTMACPHCGEDSFYTKDKAIKLAENECRNILCLKCHTFEGFSMICAAVISSLPCVGVLIVLNLYKLINIIPFWLLFIILLIIILSPVPFFTKIIFNYLRPKQS
jgi:hypothetical protein